MSASAPSDGRAWASSAAAPATVAAAALDPLTVTNRGEPSALAPGSEVARPTPGATRSGFTRPSNASPDDEKLATRPWSVSGAARAGPSVTITGKPAARRASSACAVSGGSETTGTGTVSCSPSAPAGSATRPP